MASEIRVNKIENRSGLGTVTFADTGVDLAGIVTATTFSGSGASLTALPAAQLSGTLPAISAASLTNVPAANVVGVHTSLTVTNATTTGTTIVGGGVTISESGIEASGIGITCASINGTQIGGRRNIIINGAMNVAQRNTSSTSSGRNTVDRFGVYFDGTDEAPQQAQVDVSSGTSPYGLGFRKSLRVTNGNQTSGAGADDYVWIQGNLEAQDIVNSGWNYLSTSSFITLSFWVKSSVAQDFKGYLRTRDGTERQYPFATGSLTADTWTKIVKTIPGNSGLTFDNDVNQGLQINILPFMGTSYSNNSATEDAWAAYVSAGRLKDNTSTWYETNNAEFEITGVQLEVGPQATPFEHRSYDEEFKLCQRYYQDWKDWTHPAHRGLDSNYDGHIIIDTLRIDMRANPTITQTSYGWIADGNSWVDGSNSEAASLHNDPSSDYPGRYIKITGAHNWDSNYNSTIAVKFVVAKFDAEV